MKRSNRLLCVLATATLALAACSSSTSSTPAASSTSSSPSAASSSSSAASGPPITIGVLVPIGAPFYNSPATLATIKAAVATVNTAGGVNGRPLVIDWCNESNDANKAQACARKFVTDGVVATVGSNTVTAGPSVTEILTKAKIANIDWLSLTPPEFSAPNTFPYAASSLMATAGTLALSKQLNSTKVLVVKPDSPTLTDLAPLIGQLGAKDGISEPSVVLIPRTGVADYSPYAKKIIDSGAKIVTMILTVEQTTAVVKSVHQLGGSPSFIVTGALNDTLIKNLGADADGVYPTTPTPWVNDTAEYPEMKTFVDAMNAEFARGDKDANIATANANVGAEWAGTYAAFDVLKQMAAKGTEINAANFLTAFSAATDLDTGGVSANWSPSKKITLTGYGNVSNVTIYLLKASGGKLVVAQKDPIDLLTYIK